MDATPIQDLLDEVAQLRRQNSDLQSANTALHEREKFRQGKLYVAATNIYKMDWTWTHRGDGESHLVGSKFWTSLRDALELGPTAANKWTKDQQRAAMQIAESHAPTPSRLRPQPGWRAGADMSRWTIGVLNTQGS